MTTERLKASKQSETVLDRVSSEWQTKAEVRREREGRGEGGGRGRGRGREGVRDGEGGGKEGGRFCEDSNRQLDYNDITRPSYVHVCMYVCMYTISYILYIYVFDTVTDRYIIITYRY